MPAVFADTGPGSEPPKTGIPPYIVARPVAFFTAPLADTSLGALARQGRFWYVDPGAIVPSKLTQQVQIAAPTAESRC